jgi:hypothetical protein
VNFLAFQLQTPVKLREREEENGRREGKEEVCYG